MRCPNNCGDLIEVNESKKECPKCGYSYSSSPPAPSNKKGSKYVEEVNKTIRGLLMEARMGDGIAPWQQQWVVIHKRNYDSNRVYSGINRWLLSFESELSFITKESIEKHGGTIPEGVLPRVVVAWIPPHLKKDEKNLSPEEQADTMKKRFPFMVTKYVYRSKDIPELQEKVYIEDKTNKKFTSIEEFLASTDCQIDIGGNLPLYNATADCVQVPRVEQYSSSEDYYHDLFRELVHWTGHKSRLNRDPDKFQATEDYGREELIAEMGASYLCHYFNIPIKENDVAYLDAWMKKIDADAYCLMSAGQQAEKVLKFFKLVE